MNTLWLGIGGNYSAWTACAPSAMAAGLRLRAPLLVETSGVRFWSPQMLHQNFLWTAYRPLCTKSPLSSPSPGTHPHSPTRAAPFSNPPALINLSAFAHIHPCPLKLAQAQMLSAHEPRSRKMKTAQAHAFHWPQLHSHVLWPFVLPPHLLPPHVCARSGARTFVNWAQFGSIAKS